MAKLKPGRPSGSKWSHRIRTVSTFPPPGTFSASRTGEEIARIMARPSVSPKGLGSAILMVQLFINRSEKKLTPRWRAELEEAKRILQARHRTPRGRR
jgi:hypothetical protein